MPKFETVIENGKKVKRLKLPTRVPDTTPNIEKVTVPGLRGRATNAEGVADLSGVGVATKKTPVTARNPQGSAILPPPIDSSLAGNPNVLRQTPRAQQGAPEPIRTPTFAEQTAAQSPEKFSFEANNNTHAKSLKILQNQGLRRLGASDATLGRATLAGGAQNNPQPRRAVGVQSGRGFGHRADGTIEGSTPLELRHAERLARQQQRSIRNFGGARGAEARLGIGEQLQDARDAFADRGVTRRGQDTIANTAFRRQDTDLAETQLQQQGALDRTLIGEEGANARSVLQQQGFNSRFGAQQGAAQAAVELEGFRRFANISVPDGKGGFKNIEDIGGLNQVADMFGGEQATIELLRRGDISHALLGGLVKLRNNLNNSEAFREAGTSIRDIPGFRGGEARGGDFFNNGIGALDILLGREVLRSDGNPAILEEEAFRGTGLTRADISALVEKIKQGN